ncbi:MAG: hypothetical protein M1820_001532 [Bogoriella megaspora]|nr:MAG: hypothetical protein M1820_001532 [Bogoriella megaspora]
MPHLSSDIFLNQSASSYRFNGSPIDPQIIEFHRKLPHYDKTKLIPLPSVTSELGLSQVFLKDESTRFGLPSFKILGASWGIHRALAKECRLEPTASLEEVGEQARIKGAKLVTCTEGNWGRAVSRMAKYLQIPATIFVPRYMDDATWNKISSEGAIVRRVNGEYDDAIQEAIQASKNEGMILVMDTSWDGFEDISGWVVQGYSTMLAEVDEQLAEHESKPASHAIASVGVGSWAQAVVQHYKSRDPPATVASVEPITAACLKASLEAGKSVSVQTGDTIMCGMNCGTLSSIAWPVLKAGIDASVTVSEEESHAAVKYLRERDVNAGPCGAAPLAALRKLHKEGLLKLGSDSVVVLFSTEGYRDYVIPS